MAAAIDPNRAQYPHNFFSVVGGRACLVAGEHALVWRGNTLLGKKPLPRDFPSLCRNFG
jgi:hypothetical protein